MFAVQLKLESPKAEVLDVAPPLDEPKDGQSPWWMVEISKGCMNGLNAFVEGVLLMGRF